MSNTAMYPKRLGIQWQPTQPPPHTCATGSVH